MAKTSATKLDVTTRTPGHSRETRRLRRQGLVPGVVYGGGDEPVPFTISDRDLRHALAATGAVFDVVIDGAKAEPAILKDAQRHPVRGHLMHVDMLRVDLNQPIQATVTLELVGGEEAPGVVEGGILQQLASEVSVEARPNDIPDSIQVDVSEMNVNDTMLLASVVAPAGVTLLDDPEETVIATLSAPRLSTEGEEDEIEGETEVIGEGDGGAGDESEGEAEAEAGDAGDAGDGE